MAKLEKLEKLENVEEVGKVGTVGKVGAVGILTHRDGSTSTAKTNLCRTIVDGFRKHCKRASVTLDACAEEESNSRCGDDVTGKELP